MQLCIYVTGMQVVIDLMILSQIHPNYSSLYFFQVERITPQYQLFALTHLSLMYLPPPPPFFQ